jgi:D-serine deaminase-like pyridoxal phosphate-dependent protein
MGVLIQTREWFLKNGHCCDIVSTTRAGPLRHELEFGDGAEIQASRWIFGAPAENSMESEFAPALTVLSTVISRPGYERAVVDAGLNAIAGGNRPLAIKALTDARVTMHCAENIILQLGPVSRELKIGDQVEFFVNDPQLTTMLHEKYVCIRDDQIVDHWPISARGKLT